jgi:hypothetical protein
MLKSTWPASSAFSIPSPPRKGMSVPSMAALWSICSSANSMKPPGLATETPPGVRRAFSTMRAQLSRPPQASVMIAL